LTARAKHLRPWAARHGLYLDHATPLPLPPPPTAAAVTRIYPRQPDPVEASVAPVRPHDATDP
jgi:hypothetical protein